MRKLLPLLALLACTDPSGPDSPADGLYRLVDVQFENAVVTQGCPCSGDYSFELRDGSLIGNGQMLEVQSTRKLDGTTQRIPAQTADYGTFAVVGDSVRILAARGGVETAWISATYLRDGDRLVLEETGGSGGSVYSLEVVWERD